MDFSKAIDLVIEKVKYIVIHHTATDSSLQEIHTNALNKGWLGAGYNEFIDFQGKRTIVRGNKVGAHAFGYNNKSYGIALQGNMMNRKPTPKQWEALIEATYEAKIKYPNAKVVGHRDLIPTKCPGENVDVGKLIDEVASYGIYNIKYFTDMDDISFYALESVVSMYKEGLMRGDANGQFRPKDAITREEMAIIIDRLIRRYE